MNTTTAACGHPTTAVGMPGSIARQRCEAEVCGTCREVTTILHTTAPIEYDGFGTITVDEYTGTINGRKLRSVNINNAHLEWQKARYLSGLHEAIDEMWYTKWIENGMVVV